MKHDPDALLCEACGYALAGLDEAGACPECGRAIALSLPSRRVGTAWQRAPGLVALARTMWAVVRRPRGVWEGVRVVEVRRSFDLLAAMSGVVGMAMSAALGMYLVYTSGALRTRVLDVVMINPAAWLGFAIMVWGLPMFLSMIEALGIRFIGRRRGWRTTDEVALVVVAHASVGWLAAPATILLGLGCLGLMTAISFIFPMFIPPMFIGWYADLGIVYLVFAMLLVLGHPLIGLLAFETLVFIGWRRMRFANREGGSVPR